jgi:hypothetical protein
MDSALVNRLEPNQERSPEGAAAAGVTLEPIDLAAGSIEIVQGGRRETYVLKPLRELYGQGHSGSPDPQDATFMPLFLSIEEAIARYDSTQQPLHDGTVSIALKTLSMDPDETFTDPLVSYVQFALRMLLSLNDYSRQEVRQALRKIGKSVQRHSEGGRGRGYLNFIQQFVGKMRK